MDTSHRLARLIGPPLAMIGIGMLVNRAIYREMAAQFLAAYPFIYLTGLLAVLAGLTILSAHPHWTRDWRSVITAIGWVLTIVGTYRLIAPQLAVFVAGAIVENPSFFTAAGIVLLGLGGFITYKGYTA
jgi:hypothetical protein